MNKLIICLLLLSSAASSQVKQFIWKEDANRKAIPYLGNGKNLNLDSVGVYSKANVDSLIAANTSDTIAYVATHHRLDSVANLKIKYTDTLITSMTFHRAESTYIAWHDTAGTVLTANDTLTHITSKHSFDKSIFNPVTDTELFDDFNTYPYNVTGALISRFAWGKTSGVDNSYEVSKLKIATHKSVEKEYIWSQTGTGSTVGTIDALQPFELYMGVNMLGFDTLGSTAFVGLAENYDNPVGHSIGFYFGDNQDGSLGLYWICAGFAGAYTIPDQPGSYLTSIRPSATMTHFKIISDSTNIYWYINNVLVGYLPNKSSIVHTSGQKLCFFVNSRQANIRIMNVDYVYLKSKNLTRQ